MLKLSELRRRAATLLCRSAEVCYPWLGALASKTARPALWPRWAPAPLQRAAQRSKPPLGWPRKTDSLCPACVKEVRQAVLDGRADVELLVAGHPGEIPAEIFERDGQVWMRKRCAEHGDYEDLMATDARFLERIERLFPGRDFEAPDIPLRRHGSSSVKYGRGAVLTVDLTNRCNMMCDPCFMDANQVGFVHELEWADIEKILLDSLGVRPRRQMSIQFSGGEPTLSPHFLGAIRRARELGYFCVQCASNGIRFAQSEEFCVQAKAAGLRLVYLQFDGVSNEAHHHRKVGNLFDVKRRAIEHLHAAGIDVVLVVTVVRTINDDQVGEVVRFAIENADKITVVSFQPVSFTGRDEDVDDERRALQRYTLSHLAHDLKDQLGSLEPARDWFPLSAMNPFSDWVDAMMGSRAAWGALKCGCHPNCGIGTAILVHKQTKQAVPVARFLDLERLLADVQQIADGGHGKGVGSSLLALSVMRNFRPHEAPEGFGLVELFRQLVSQIGADGEAIGASEGDATHFQWRLLFVAGMWFQDLFNYDFRRTEMCIIPYGTQRGEISFCAYNTGVGWRQVVEKMHATASVAEWYRTRGRHAVFAKGQDLPIPGGSSGSSGAPDDKRRLPLVGSAPLDDRARSSNTS